MKRVLYITSYASPYRVEYFDALGELVDLTVVFTELQSDQTHRDKSWFHQGKGNFQAVELKKKLCRVRKSPLFLDVISWLKKPFDRIVVHGYGTPTNLLALTYLRARRIPFELEVDGGLIRADSGKKRKLKDFILRGAALYWSSGESATRYLKHYGVPGEKIREYPFSSLHEGDVFPAPAAREEKKRLREKLGLEEEQIILSIGQFIPRKGYDLFFRALEKMDRSVGVYIIGGQPTQEYLDMQREMGLQNVHFLGFRKKDTLADYYRAADVFVLPTREDIWGLVINEALAAGLPIVTTDRCGAGLDLVENGKNGFVVPVGDTAAMAARIRQLLQGDLYAMGEVSLKKIERYTIEEMARSHCRVWEA